MSGWWRRKMSNQLAQNIGGAKMPPVHQNKAREEALSVQHHSCHVARGAGHYEDPGWGTVTTGTDTVINL